MLSKQPLSDVWKRLVWILVSIRQYDVSKLYLVSESFKSPFANVKVNFSLSVDKICNIICWYDPLNFVWGIQSPREKQFLPHNASESTPGSQFAKPWTSREGRELGRWFASLLSLQTWEHLISHKLKVTKWVLRSQASIKQHGYKKTGAANVNKISTRQNNSNLCKCNFGGGHILQLLFLLWYCKCFIFKAYKKTG